MSVSLDSISLTSPADALSLLRIWLRTERQRVCWTQGEGADPTQADLDRLARDVGIRGVSESR